MSDCGSSKAPGPRGGARPRRDRPVVAIDGPTAAGKSTVARAVARRFGFLYVDTGAMYRSVALAALKWGVDLDDSQGLADLARDLSIELEAVGEECRVLVDGEDVTSSIRSPEVSAASSLVSAVAGVREILVARQRAMGAAGGVVMEGRDIGTVVFPDADVKVFLEASLEARARRRWEELRARGVAVELDEVRRSETERDSRDRTRDLSPLRPAADAVVVDTTGQGGAQVIEAVVRLVQERMDAV